MLSSKTLIFLVKTALVLFCGLSRFSAQIIQVSEVFHHWGTHTPQNWDHFLRSSWTLEDIGEVLNMHRLKEAEVVEDFLNPNELKLEILLRQMNHEAKSSGHKIWDLFNARVSGAGNEVKMRALWSRLYADLDARCLLAPGSILFNVPEELERGFPQRSESSNSAIVEESIRLFVDLIGEFPLKGKWLEQDLEMYIRAHRILYSLPYEAREHSNITEKFLIQMKPKECSEETSDQEPWLANTLKIGIVQKDLLFLLHPSMHSYNWNAGHFFEPTSSFQTSRLLEVVRKMARGQKFNVYLEGLMDEIFKLKPASELDEEGSAAIFRAIDEDILDSMDSTRKKHGLAKFYYENILLKTDLDVLPRLIRIIYPIFPDYTLEALGEIYLKHGFSNNDWSSIRHALEKILFNRQEILGKN